MIESDDPHLHEQKLKTSEIKESILAVSPYSDRVLPVNIYPGSVRGIHVKCVNDIKSTVRQDKVAQIIFLEIKVSDNIPII